MGLYEIEEQAGEIMSYAGSLRQELLEHNQKQMEECAMELEGEMEGRLTILRSQLEEQTKEEIAKLMKTNQKQVEELNQLYHNNLKKFAQEIVEKIIEV